MAASENSERMRSSFWPNSGKKQEENGSFFLIHFWRDSGLKSAYAKSSYFWSRSCSKNGDLKGPIQNRVRFGFPCFWQILLRLRLKKGSLLECSILSPFTMLYCDLRKSGRPAGRPAGEKFSSSTVRIRSDRSERNFEKRSRSARPIN